MRTASSDPFYCGSVVYAGISGIDGGNSAMMPAVRDIKEEK